MCHLELFDKPGCARSLSPWPRLSHCPLTAFPPRAVCRLRADGANAGLWSLLCGCCFGGRQKVLALDLDAPVGWLQWEDTWLAGQSFAGPVRLALHVLDAEEYLDAMGIVLAQ